MTDQEAKQQEQRITKFRELEKLRDEIRGAISMVTEPWKDGPHGQGPFTGNTRESRRVRSIEIRFTPTLGGAPAVETKIENLGIEACALGRFLEGQLRERLALVLAEMEKV